MPHRRARGDQGTHLQEVGPLPEELLLQGYQAHHGNKQWDIPTSTRAKRYKKMRKVRFHIRTRGEGLSKGFTKPSAAKKQRINPGAYVNVVGGIVGGRIRLWHYLPKKRRLNAKMAVEVYEGLVKKVLARCCGRRTKKYLILEDNDPAGYKSNAALKRKRELGIEAIEFPPYSPDLNPLDFSLWHEIEERMLQRAPKKETVGEYKKRLRRTALALPGRVVLKAVADIRVRAAMIVEAEGGDIAKD